MFAPGIGLAGVALIVTALMPRLDLAALPAALMGFGGGLSFITGYTMLQEHTADVVRGRTFAAFNTGVRGALFAALVIAPFLVGVIGPETTIGVRGSVEYMIGGVRITMMLAGAAAVLGAVYSGRSIHRVLTSEQGLRLEIEPIGATGRRGLFVVFEGGEGAGKSTQVRLLRAAVERAGYDALVTREPGGTPIGEQVRSILLDPATRNLGDRAEALLYAAARAQHVEEVIRPALDKGAVVLCDRFVDSSVVYQGVARGLGDTQVAELNRWGTGDLQPDLTIVLDVDAAEGLRRAGDSPDRLENEGVAFHRTVNEGFRRRAAAHPDRYLLIDATAPVETVHARIRAEVLDRLGEGAAS
jgi:dTMP kinase